MLLILYCATLNDMFYIHNCCTSIAVYYISDSIEEDSSLADVSLIESQQEDPTSEKESRTQESCVDDIVSEDKSDTILYINGEKHAFESEKEPGLMSKLKRTLRNFRYKTSPGGQKTIRKV